MNPDYYQILGVSRYASAEELKKAYKKLAKELHPDRHQGSSYHEEQFKLINEAYQTLSDPDKKRMYDWKLLYSNSSQSAYNSDTQNAYTGRQTNTTKKKPRKKTATPPSKPNPEYKYFIIAISIIAAISIAGVWFYGVMNRYTSNLHLHKAIDYNKKALYKQAYYEIEEAIAYNDRNAQAQLIKGKLSLIFSRKYERAIQSFTNAIAASDTFYHDAYFERAKVLIKNGEYPSAMNDLTELINHPPVADSVLWLKAELHYFQDDFPNASINYDKFLQNHKECSDCLAKLLYGGIQQKKFRTSLEQLNTYIQNGVDTTKISPYIIAILYLGVRDSSTAIKYIDMLEDGSLEKISADKLLKNFNETK